MLDATFDDLCPLAQTILDTGNSLQVLKPFAATVIRRHYDYNVSSQLAHYSGPVVVIRRLRDEIMSGGTGVLANSRTSRLAVATARQRFDRDAADKPATKSHSHKFRSVLDLRPSHQWHRLMKGWTHDKVAWAEVQLLQWLALPPVRFIPEQGA